MVLSTDRSTGWSIPFQVHSYRGLNRRWNCSFQLISRLTVYPASSRVPTAWRDSVRKKRRERGKKEGKKMMKMIPAGSRISREGNSSIFVVGPNCFFPRMRFLFRLDNGTRRLNSATVCFSPILNSLLSARFRAIKIFPRLASTIPSHRVTSIDRSRLSTEKSGLIFPSRRCSWTNTSLIRSPVFTDIINNPRCEHREMCIEYSP